MDTALVARQLVRALRGRRSQTALSRRLGFKTNVVYAWESGRTAPTAAQLLEVAQRTGVDLLDAFHRFQRRQPAWLGNARPASREAVVRFLNHQRGTLPLAELSRLSGFSRFALSRWLKGEAEPKAPQFLHVIECCSRRVADFVAALVDPERVPAMLPEWQRQQALRKAAYELPWSHAVLRALELDDYRRLERHQPGWFAERLGMTPDQERLCLELLEATGQIKRGATHWELEEIKAVDLRHEPGAALAQRSFWAQVGADRVPTHRGLFAYNLCGVSCADLARLEALQRDFMRQARAIISQSGPTERVALIQVQVFALDETRAG